MTQGPPGDILLNPDGTPVQPAGQALGPGSMGIDQGVGDVASLGLPDTALPGLPSGSDFATDEWDMQIASGRTGVFAGWKLPKDVSRHDFFELVSYAEQFAAITGWKYYPTPQQLVDATHRGIISGGAQAVFQWLGSLSPGVQQQMPWAQYGLTHDAWVDKQGSYLDVAEGLSGNRNIDPGLLQRAMSERWSTTRFENTLRQDHGFRSANPWIDYGYNYSSFQQFKLQNKQEIVNRFGAGSDQNNNTAVQLLSNPLTPISASGTAVTSMKQQSPLQSRVSNVR